MGPIFRLSLRQLLGKWRIAIIVLLAAVPVGLVAVIRAFNVDLGADDLDELAVGIVGVLDGHGRSAHRDDDAGHGQFPATRSRTARWGTSCSTPSRGGRSSCPRCSRPW